MLRKALFTLAFVIGFLSSVSAQTNTSETLTITTYYPAPYGVYRNLRLHPSVEPTIGVDRGVVL
ncbi:MAG: hypothetical protein NTY14_04530 [Candidatus Omnitrophica bacterium]|nr:hypothetical protein [Candidatus Omnitrophota bacterium]